MVREDIVSGLRNAVSRGYGLDMAVQSYINAGYKKEDVIEAAHRVQNVGGQPMQQSSNEQSEQQIQPKQNQTNEIQSPGSELTPVDREVQQIQKQKPLPNNTKGRDLVSEYNNSGQKPKKERKTMMTVLIVVLILLSLILIAGVIVYFAVPDFFSKLFG